MAEYIEREAALRPFIIDKQGNRIRETDVDNWLVDISIRQVKRLIREVPAADVVEVVRCNDCMHYEPCEGGKDYCWLNDMAVVENDFCSYGERRNDETD